MLYNKCGNPFASRRRICAVCAVVGVPKSLLCKT